jgi:hypothetical protein
MVRRYLLFISVVAAILIAGALIASELLRGYPTRIGTIIFIGIVLLLAAAWIKDSPVLRVFMWLPRRFGIELVLLAILLASTQLSPADHTNVVVFAAILLILPLVSDEIQPPQLTRGWVLRTVIQAGVWLTMALMFLFAVYMLGIHRDIGIVMLYAVIALIAVLSTPPSRRARRARSFFWLGAGLGVVWMGVSLAGRLRDSAPHDRGGVALVVILAVFVLVILLRFHRFDALAARLGDWLRG